jgi:hypothetical protein
MKNIKLSNEDKKIINKYNHLLMAVVGDDGLFADAYASQDENIYDFSGLYSRKSNELIQTQNEGYKLLSSIIEDFLDSIDFNDYLYCDTCSGYGSVNVIYDPFTSKFEVTLEVGEVISHDYNYVSTFEELKNTTNGMWGHKYDELKKLGDSKFIEKMKQDYGNILEISYEGGGDSGEINSYGDTSSGSVVIGQDIEYVGYEVIDIKFSGWENNEGGDGSIKFNFKDQNLEIHHTNNVEDSFTEEIETLMLI